MMNHPTDPRTTSESPNLPKNAVAPLRLRFRGGQHHGQVVRVSSQKCTIGSAPNATLRLSCPGVHPVHCLVLRGEAGTVIRRMSPDTLLNREPFEDAKLSAGDTLSIGPIEFEVLPDADQSVVPSASQSSEPSADAGTAEKLAALEAQLAQLTSERDKWDEYRVAEESRLKEWAQSLEDHSQQMQISQENNQTSEVRFREQLEALESTNQQLAGKLEELQSQYDAEVASNREQKAAVEASLAARATLDTELDGLRNQVVQFESLSSEKQQLAAEVATLREQLDAATQAQQESAAQSQSAASIQEEHDAMVREVEVMRKQIDQAEEYCNKWEQQQEQLEGDLAAANLANSEKENELQSLRSKFADTDVGAMEERWNAERQQLQLQLQYAQQQLANLGQASPEAEQQSTGFVANQPQDIADSPEVAEAQVAEAPPAAEANFVPPTQTMSMDEFQSFSEAGAAQSGSATEVYDHDESATEPGRDSAMAMLDKLRAELGTGSETQTEQPPVQEQAPAAAYTPEPEPVAAEPVAGYTPQPEEEVTFAEPESAAPVDTASILAQFGHAVEEDETPEPAVVHSQPAAATPAPESEDDIQDYMAQLMQRVGGDGAAEAAKESTPIAPTQKIEVPKEPAPQAAVAPTPKPSVLDPSEFVPRAVAPEADLKALRAVANTSTRSALDRHQRRSLDTKALLSGILAMVAFCVCISAGYFSLASKQIVSLSSLACLVSGFIGILALLKALAFSARSKLGKSRRKQNLKQLSAR